MPISCSRIIRVLDDLPLYARAELIVHRVQYIVKLSYEESTSLKILGCHKLNLIDFREGVFPRAAYWLTWTTISCALLILPAGF